MMTGDGKGNKYSLNPTEYSLWRSFRRMDDMDFMTYNGKIEEEERKAELESRRVGLRHKPGLAVQRGRKNGMKNSMSDSKVRVNSAQGSLPDDGFRWRKCGEMAFGPNGRSLSYFKCGKAECKARKSCDKRAGEPGVVEVTYRGEHTCRVERDADEGAVPSSHLSSDSQPPPSPPRTDVKGDSVAEEGRSSVVEDADPVLSRLNSGMKDMDLVFNRVRGLVSERSLEPQLSGF